MEVCDQRHAPAALPPTKGPADYFTGRRLGHGTGQNGYANSCLIDFQPVESHYSD